MSVEELIAKLESIEERLKDKDLDLDDIIPEEYCTGVGYLAEEVLISFNGQCNWENIGKLKAAGYDVFPIERDRFGWMIAGIQTGCGVITYG
jgi:hypothetical protein